MRAVRLALSLLRVPQLFFTLVAFPLLMSLVLVWIQILFTDLFTKRIRAESRVTETAARAPEPADAFNVLRQLLHGGDGKPIGEPIVCRWELRGKDATGEDLEYPPNDGCNPERLDVAIQVENVATFDVTEYVDVFRGNVFRIHVCQTCDPDTIIKVGKDGKVETHIKSVYAGMLLTLAHQTGNILRTRNDFHNAIGRYNDMIGTKIFHSYDFAGGIDIDGLLQSLPVIFNIILLVMTALWLSLKAHRKVLDYFARSGALLPMVAAAGNQTFYRAMWLLTFLRVVSFLIGAVPMTAFALYNVVGENELKLVLLDDGWLAFGLWMLTLLAGLTFATLVASVADLKHRHSLFSFMYRYVPIVLSLIGGLVWSCSFLSINEIVAMLREVIISMPIIGLGPMLIAPLIHTKVWIMLVHLVLTGALLYFALKKNARWFAAHLEEI